MYKLTFLSVGVWLDGVDWRGRGNGGARRVTEVWVGRANRREHGGEDSGPHHGGGLASWTTRGALSPRANHHEG